MRATYGCEGNERRVCHSFGPDDRSLLFRTSNDLMVSILSYLCIKNVCNVDITVSNTAERIAWLKSLSWNNLAGFSEYTH